MQQAVDVVEDVVFGDLVADRVAVELEDDAGDVVDAAVAVVVYFGVVVDSKSSSPSRGSVFS